MTAIPIQNLYYLLCYAWNRLEERDIVNVSTTDAQNLLDLFSRVIVSGTNHLLKKGVDRGYKSFNENTGYIRGKLDISTTIKKDLLSKCKANCQFDELSHDVLHNQILKTTINCLLKHSKVSKENLKGLMNTSRRLHGISEVTLSSRLFRKIQLHQGNAFYGFLLSICRLIYENVLAKEGDGDFKFRDFSRDSSQMPALFENFVRNFYACELRKEYPQSRLVGKEKIKWITDDSPSNTFDLLPSMETDISIRFPERYIVVDTKFYSKTLQVNFDKKSIHSGNLYQIYAYLRHLEGRGEEYLNCEGLLLYPTVDETIDFDFQTHGHRIKIKTVNLADDWKKIHHRLIEILN